MSLLPLVTTDPRISFEVGVVVGGSHDMDTSKWLSINEWVMAVTVLVYCQLPSVIVIVNLSL